MYVSFFLMKTRLLKSRSLLRNCFIYDLSSFGECIFLVLYPLSFQFVFGISFVLVLVCLVLETGRPGTQSVHFDCLYSQSTHKGVN